MLSLHSLSRARLTAWLFTFLLLAQPWLVVTGFSASPATVDETSKWHDASIQTEQPQALIINGEPDVTIRPAWERFERAALSDLTVFWHHRTGTPEAIYGLMADVSAQIGDPETAARDFLAQAAALFKIGSTADLQLLKLSESLGGYHVLFQQTYQGLPVHDAMMGVPGMLGVHIDRAGRIHALVSSYVPDVSLASLRPTISSEDVYDQMLAALGVDRDQVSLFGDPGRALVIYMAFDGTHLAWRITIPAREPLGTWDAFWDAQTGVQLSPLLDRNYYVDGTGRVFVPNAVVATGINTLSDQNDSASAVPSNAYSTVTLLGVDGSGFLNGPLVNTNITANRVRRSNNNFTDLDRSQRGFEEVEIYWAIDTAQRYIQGFEIFSAGNYSISVDAHGLTEDNSFYSGNGSGRGIIRFGDGGVDDAEDAEIIWHEYGHAILDNQVPGIDQRFDGLGEGFGDYWGATMSTLFPSANRAMYDPAVGEWDATFYNPGNSTRPPFLRRVDTNAHYPENRSSDEHITGMIWSRALWDIHNSIGREAADEIILEGNFLMPFSPTLPQAAQAVLRADQNINGGANQAALTAAFVARGLVSAPPASITVLSPNGGEFWQVGSEQMITWRSTSVSGNVNIRVSRDGGTSFQDIFSNLSNTGSVPWTVTGPATTQARIQVISVANSAIRDSSDSNFTISNDPPPNPTITVVAPNGGETWPISTTQTIRWSSINVSGNVKIEVSRDGGDTFETLFDSTANDGSENWTVTGPATTQAVMKISSVTDSSINDTSDSPFTISGPPPPPSGSITVLAPNGGENWSVGSVRKILWSSVNVTGNVKIEVSRDGGGTFETLFESTANDGSESWTVTGPATTQAVVKISSVSDSSVNDRSDGPFTISGTTARQDDHPVAKR